VVLFRCTGSYFGEMGDGRLTANQVVYLVIVVSLGVLAVVVSLWDKFGTPRYRPLRAGEEDISNAPNPNPVGSGTFAQIRSESEEKSDLLT
jgi:hypothetical protein